MLPGTRDAQVAWGDGSGSWVIDPLLPQLPSSPARLARRGDRRPGPVWGPLAWSRPGLNRSRGRVLPLMPAVPGRVEMAVSLPASATASR